MKLVTTVTQLAARIDCRICLPYLTDVVVDEGKYECVRVTLDNPRWPCPLFVYDYRPETYTALRETQRVGFSLTQARRDALLREEAQRYITGTALVTVRREANWEKSREYLSLESTEVEEPMALLTLVHVEHQHLAYDASSSAYWYHEQYVYDGYGHRRVLLLATLTDAQHVFNLVFRNPKPVSGKTLMIGDRVTGTLQFDTQDTSVVPA